MNIFLRKMRSLLRDYWQLLMAAIGTFFGFLLLRRKDREHEDSIKKMLDSHKIEIEKINFVIEEERRQRAENEKQLKIALEAVQLEYETAKKQLDEKKKKEIEEIVNQYGKDPIELAKKLSEATGFSIILPS